MTHTFAHERVPGGQALAPAGAPETRDLDRLLALLGEIGTVNTVGESFTVYKVGPVDVALPRTESKRGRGHRGFVVTGDPHLPIEQAARRRDFTLNAIAWDPLHDE